MKGIGSVTYQQTLPALHWLNWREKMTNLLNIIVALITVYFLSWLMDIAPKDVVGWVALGLAATAGTK